MSVYPVAVLGDARRNLAPSQVKAYRVVAMVGDTSVEVLLPKGSRDLHLSWPRWSVVFRFDPFGGPPYFDFTDDGNVRPTALRSPDAWRAVAGSATSNLIGETNHQLRPLHQIPAPDGMIMKR